MRILPCALVLALALPTAAEPAPPPSEAAPPAAQPAAPPTPPPADLDFDLFQTDPAPAAPAAPAVPTAEERSFKLRRRLLNVHQGVGLALVAGTLGSVVTGQLGYGDKFGGDNTGRYKLVHAAFTYPTVGLSVAAAAAALAAPVPFERPAGFSRMSLHRIGQFTALAGWLGQLGLGLWTVSREGYANQRSVALGHLVLGYVTLGGLLLGESAIVF